MTEVAPPAGEASGGAAGADWDAADPAAPEGEAAKEGDKDQEAAAEQPAEPVAPPTPVEEEKVSSRSLGDQGTVVQPLLVACCCRGRRACSNKSSSLTGRDQGLHP